MSGKPRIAIVVGYFDWFSGYQETVIARALAGKAEVEVIASDRVSPIFSDAHLAEIGCDRKYRPVVCAPENGVLITRLKSFELRSMVWSTAAVRYMRNRKYDLVVQVMPGQGLPIAATLARMPGKRVAAYGDNSAMWVALSPFQRWLKWQTFALTKGAAYRYVNRRSDHIYGYTPETVARLAPFSGNKSFEVLPLAYSEGHFAFDPALRAKVRAELGIKESDIVIGTAGKMRPEKRIESLVDAVDRLVLAGSTNVRLVIAGCGVDDYSRGFAERVDSSDSLRPITTLLGVQNSQGMNEVFNLCDIGVWPVQPAITIQQGLGTGLFAVLPRNELVGHLLRGDSGLFMDGLGGSEELFRALSAAIRMPLDAQTRTAREKTNRWLSGSQVSDRLLNLAVSQPSTSCDGEGPVHVRGHGQARRR